MTLLARRTTRKVALIHATLLRHVPQRKSTLLLATATLFLAVTAGAQEREIPHNQSAPPNDPYTAQEAAARMTVPEGFSVEVVAAEPDLVNPVAMAFDHRGRIWVVESLEYPRMSAGPGQDRIKILEDTDGDGQVDDVKIFAEGLNIPSGIAIGHGGVWVANSPDILLLKDTDGDDRADEREVIVTGFGRTDTHELPNSLTWGPDGYLYGLNGVFNYSRVEQDGKSWDFTCAMFRIDPKTRKFELFAEGTSNPWGIAWNNDGQAFLSACVIDHLWHLTETGYYHRQAGAYPPYTWKIESIVDHRHQKAAYCGITYFDSPAYPEEYRGRLYMGNIHGNCINVDSLTRRGATYQGHGEPDFLQANDAWFMPVSQKTGPDGCLYVLDWYDRYHCYQDARRDPEGIDRLKGRLYRVRYQETPRKFGFDLSKLSDEELVELLGDSNVYFRRQAQRLLGERGRDTHRPALIAMVRDSQQPTLARRHGLWALLAGQGLRHELVLELLDDPDSIIRAFAVRAAGNQSLHAPEITARLAQLATDPSADVRLQVAIALPKLNGAQAVDVLLAVLRQSDDDGLTPNIVWSQLLELMAQEPAVASQLLDRLDLAQWQGNELGLACLNRAFEWILDNASQDPDVLVACLLKLQSFEASEESLQSALKQLIVIAQATRDEQFQQGWGKNLIEVLQKENRSDRTGEIALACRAMLGDQEALRSAKESGVDSDDPEIQMWSLQAIQRWDRTAAVQLANEFLADRLKDADADSQRRWLAWLARFSEPEIGQAITARWEQWSPNVKPSVTDTLSSRAPWALALLDAIDEQQVPRSSLNVNQVRKILALNDPGLAEKVANSWGTIREGRAADREELIQKMRDELTEHIGDPFQGKVVYQRVCGQCHKMYGEGFEVGPELTSNGRGTFDQLLSNVFDPSLVIGAAYQATLVETIDGRVESGLVIEDQPNRVVLRTQGAKEVVIPRADIEAIQKSPLSLMPENLQENVTPDEMRHLFALLMLDRPADDPHARWIPGILSSPVRNFIEPAEYGRATQWNLAGFQVEESGENGVGLLDQHFGRSVVVRTHPVSRTEPCRITRTLELQDDRHATLYLSASHDPHGTDWQLIVKANGETLVDQIVGPDAVTDGWLDLKVDLSSFAGKTVELEILNQANDWNYEFGYFGRVFVVEEPK